MGGPRGRIGALLVVLTLAGLCTLAASPPATPRLRLADAMSAREFEACGLAKLTATELATLEAWVERHAARPADGAPPAAAPKALAAVPAKQLETVAFNSSNGKYHCRSCEWARRCTVNCIDMPLDEASRQGVPCKVCGGSCR